MARILIADDNEPFGALLKTLLEGMTAGPFVAWPKVEMRPYRKLLS